MFITHRLLRLAQSKEKYVSPAVTLVIGECLAGALTSSGAMSRFPRFRALEPLLWFMLSDLLNSTSPRSIRKSCIHVRRGPDHADSHNNSPTTIMSTARFISYISAR